MKRLMSTVVAVMAFGLFAFADETMEEWFAEDAETVAAALTAAGKTDDGTWSNYGDGQLTVDADRIVLDADDATPVAYRPDAQLLGLRASVMLTDITFDAARGVLPELPDGAQAAVTITTNAEGGCVFAVANNGAWEVTEKEADPAAEYAVKVDFTYADAKTVSYSVSNETGWVSLKSDAVNPVSAKKISTVEFAGSGSFSTFVGAYPSATIDFGNPLPEGVASVTVNGDELVDGKATVPQGAAAVIVITPKEGWTVKPTVIALDSVTEDIDYKGAKFPAEVKPLVTGIEYIDENGQLQTNTAYEVVTEDTTILTNGGWYAVTEDVEITDANITVDGAAHLILCDGATLTVTNVPDECAAIDVSVVGGVTNALFIYGQTAGTGELNVFGGEYGAGIGGGYEGEGGTVTINGGTVTAFGDCGAGIGGGSNGAGGTVTINGGTVTAIGDWAAGIGGGDYGVGGRVTINGGTTTATGSHGGAGIGGGKLREGGVVTINDGVVTATGDFAAGIGGGAGGSGGTVMINGGVVTAIGRDYGAGIGGGYEGGAGGTVMINGGVVTAIGDCAAGIGGGFGGAGGTVTFGGSFSGGVLAGVDAEHASVMTTEEYEQDHGAAFVTMPVPAAVRIPQVVGVTYVVSNGTEEVEGLYLNGMNTYVVEPGDSLELYFVLNSGCEYKNPPAKNPMDLGSITGIRTVDLSELPTANLPEVSYFDWDGEKLVETNTSDYVDYRGDVALVGGKTYVVRESMIVGVRIKVNSTADNPTRLILCDNATLTAAKGVEVSVNEDGATTNALIICGQTDGTGKLVATGAADGAGIGGGYDCAGGIVTINGVSVTAAGGEDGTAGIGGGIYGAGGVVMINGGVVLATGNECCAGIGGGGGNYDAGGIVTINGGTVTAIGGSGYEGAYGGAGIGGGVGGDGGTVVITGGKVTAHGKDGGEDIGHGYNSDDSGTVTISGGLFWDGLQDKWIAAGFAKTANTDPETQDDYPWAVVKGVMPVAPGEPIVCDTAEEASNVLKRAAFTPSEEVAKALGGEGAAALRTYCKMFTLDVVPTSDGKWAVEAFLLPPDWTNVVESAQAATRQIPLADIAAWQSGDDPIPVQLTNCVPGFFYSLFDGAVLTELKADSMGDGANCNVLCGIEKTVDLPLVMKPAGGLASGFFTIGVLEAPVVIPGETESRTNRYTGPKKPVRQH